MTEPSDGTKPSRGASNGLLASSGLALLVLRARMTANPANPNLLIPASVPPANATSMSPLRIASNASPIA